MQVPKFIANSSRSWLSCFSFLCRTETPRQLSHVCTCCIWLWSDISEANSLLYELSALTIFFPPLTSELVKHTF